MDDILDSALDALEKKSEKDDSGSASRVQEDKSSSGSKLQPSNDEDVGYENLVNEMQKQLSQLMTDSSGDDMVGLDDTEQEIKSMIHDISAGMQAMDPENAAAELSETLGGDDFLDEMMGQLLAKDLMYEPMREVQERYPSWLESNKSKISASEFERYSAQYERFTKLVRLYEKQPENMPMILEAVQEIQDLGQPPPELINAVAPGLGSQNGEATLEGLLNGKPECIIT